MAEKNLNRIKVMLAEKGENEQMACRETRQRPSDHFQMVY